MDPFSYKDGILHAEDVPLDEIAAENGTPTYVYSRSHIENQWKRYEGAFCGRENLICYAVKANSNLAVLNLLAKLGSGFDIVSIGELERVIRAEGDPSKIVFSGVGKRLDEIERALKVGIGCFNVESEVELKRICDVAIKLGVRASVSLRLNPDVDARTHPHITTGLTCNKFGIGIDKIMDICDRIFDMPFLNLVGLGFHIGSQMTSLLPLEEACTQALGLTKNLQNEGIALKQINVGGGLGIAYKPADNPPTIEKYVKTVLKYFGDQKLKIVAEPGRAIVGNAGVLLTRVEYVKEGPNGRHFVIVDCGINDIMRPALYDAWHDVKAVHRRKESVFPCDVVGPICETADTLARDRELGVFEGDLLAVYGAGAYGFSLSSQYNSRPRAAEVMVDGGASHLIRKRETLDVLMQGERTWTQVEQFLP